MTAKEYLEKDSEVWRKIDDSNLTKAAMIEFAQNYHDSEVKNLGLFSVSQRSELFFELLKFAMPKNYTDEAIKNIVAQFIDSKNCS
jgi:hypothetical protein